MHYVYLTNECVKYMTAKNFFNLTNFICIFYLGYVMFLSCWHGKYNLTLLNLCDLG